jgi:hypothetical protein
VLGAVMRLLTAGFFMSPRRDQAAAGGNLAMIWRARHGMNATTLDGSLHRVQVDVGTAEML